MRLPTITSSPIIRFGLAIAYSVFLWILLTQNGEAPVIPTGIEPAPPSLKREIIFTSAHVISFVILTIGWIWALWEVVGKHMALIVAVLIALCIGTYTEIFQFGVIARFPSWNDLIANSLAVIFSAIVIYWLSTRHQLS